MLKFAVMVTLSLAFIGCGDGDSELEEALENATIVSIFGGTKEIRFVDDSLFSLSCNQFYTDFLVSANNACTAVTVSVDYNTSTDVFDWAITSPDGTVDISGVEDSDAETLTIDDTTYYCYIYSGSVLDSEGNEIFFGSHQLWTSAVTAQPSTLDGTTVGYLGFDSADACASIDK